MGKNLIQQRRGKGSPTFRSASFKYDIKAKLPINREEFRLGKISKLIHCGMHSAPLIEITYDNRKKMITIAPEGVRVGDSIEMTKEDVKRGNIMELNDIPEGTQIFNIESIPGDGGKFVRSSGQAAKVSTKSGKYVMIKLPSGKTKKFKPNCRACIGVAAGGGRLEKPLLKAGKAFFKYKAKNKLWPHVCGQSMNAVAHPFGKKSSHTKGQPRQASRNAPPGRKVGSIAPRRTGHKR